MLALIAELKHAVLKSMFNWYTHTSSSEYHFKLNNYMDTCSRSAPIMVITINSNIHLQSMPLLVIVQAQWQY